MSLEGHPKLRNGIGNLSCIIISVVVVVIVVIVLLCKLVLLLGLQFFHFCPSSHKPSNILRLMGGDILIMCPKPFFFM